MSYQSTAANRQLAVNSPTGSLAGNLGSPEDLSSTVAILQANFAASFQSAELALRALTNIRTRAPSSTGKPIELKLIVCSPDEKPSASEKIVAFRPRQRAKTVRKA